MRAKSTREPANTRARLIFCSTTRLVFQKRARCLLPGPPDKVPTPGPLLEIIKYLLKSWTTTRERRRRRRLPRYFRFLNSQDAGSEIRPAYVGRMRTVGQVNAKILLLSYFLSKTKSKTVTLNRYQYFENIKYIGNRRILSVTKAI